MRIGLSLQRVIHSMNSVLMQRNISCGLVNFSAPGSVLFGEKLCSAIEHNFNYKWGSQRLFYTVGSVCRPATPHLLDGIAFWLCVLCIFTRCTEMQSALQCDPTPQVGLHSGNNAICVHLHLTILCVFSLEMDNLSEYRSHFKAKCKWDHRTRSRVSEAQS